jgi:hypothetical protein
MTIVDRRLDRRSASAHGIASARISPAKRVRIVDASPSGVLVETTHRLLPGADVELHVETSTGRAIVRGRLVRCHVARLSSVSVSYRAAIAFAERLSWLTLPGE